jgi:O-acetyl-ADP-ribose deacetylase (regulator of RNase III)
MKLHFVDSNREVSQALAAAFRDFPDVEVSCGDILSLARVCVVSPANGYGYMDGGVDAAYREYFGRQVEDSVRAAIAARPEGYLPVGASIVIRTEDEKIPFMIVAPTMVMPEAVPASHAARAMRAVLRAQAAHSGAITSVFCPALATGVGVVPPDEAAAVMASAYREWKKAPNQSSQPTPGS